MIYIGFTKGDIIHINPLYVLRRKLANGMLEEVDYVLVFVVHYIASWTHSDTIASWLAS